MEDLDLSVVILAKVHNPSILHDAFLKREGIVPQEWAEPEESISTPPFARIRYGNGIVIIVELNKLQVIDNDPPKSLRDSPSIGIVRKYVQVLPHVTYTALGLNITGFTERQNASEYLINRFMTSGPWNSGETRPQKCSFTLEYLLPSVKVSFNIDASSVQKPSHRERKGILLRGNYHVDIPSSKERRSGEQVASEMAGFSNCFDHYFDFSSMLLGQKEIADESH